MCKKTAAEQPSLVRRTPSDNWTCNNCMKPTTQHRHRNWMGYCSDSKLRHQDGLFFFLLAASLSIPSSLWLSLSRFPPLTPSVFLSLSACKLDSILYSYACSTWVIKSACTTCITSSRVHAHLIEYYVSMPAELAQSSLHAKLHQITKACMHNLMIYYATEYACEAWSIKSACETQLSLTSLHTQCD